MRYALSSILAALTICVFAGVGPAAATGNSGDANGMWRHAEQTHPNEANQDPDYRRGFIEQGEVYPPGTLSGGHFRQVAPCRRRAARAGCPEWPHLRTGLRRLVASRSAAHNNARERIFPTYVAPAAAERNGALITGCKTGADLKRTQ